MGRGLRLMHRLGNPAVAAVLGSPLHRALSGLLMLVSYTGRRTGAVHRRPVMYARADDATLAVMVGMPEQKVWWRNLADGAPVTVRVRGADLRGWAEVVTGDAGLRAAWVRRFPRAARGLPADPVMVRVRIEG